ncbi:MAG: helical backbone metal receptor [Kineosporiaceae bacterium]
MAPFTTRRAALLGALALPVLALAACGDDAPAPASSPASPVASSGPAYPLRLSASPNPSFAIEKQPAAIVSLSPTATEVLYAVGAGGQVKAVDDQSSYPAQAPRTKLSGFQPNVEAIAGYAPDLVILSNDSNGVADGLRKLDVPVYLMPAPDTLAGAYAQWQELGDVVGRHAQAGELVESVRKRIADAVAKAPAAAKGATVYHELDQTFYSVSSATFIGDVYRQFGLTNIADGPRRRRRGSTRSRPSRS